MKPLFIRSSQYVSYGRHRERGVTIVLVAISMVAIIAMAAISIDVVTLYLARGEAQRTADAAALAGARVISMSGVTGAPTDTANWSSVCTGAAQVAQAVAKQSAVGGSAVTNVNVNFVYNGTDTGTCSSLPGAFAVNPQVQVQVQQTGLPTFFSRIWGRTGNTISATATAEVLNPSGSGAVSPGGNLVPVQPRCVKPWVVPNLDPLNSPNKFVNLPDGSIAHTGISLGGSGTNGVIGETFNLFPDCFAGGTCGLRDTIPVANHTPSGSPTGPIPPLQNLEYLPGEVTAASTAVPTDGTDSCSDVVSNYAQAVAGCDQTTNYQCGVLDANVVDLSENPRTSDSTSGVQCLVHQSTAGLGNISGQDTLDDTAFPFKINAGTRNPLGLSGSVITSSNSIVSLPIFDTKAMNPTGTTPVTIVGFLQVFINSAEDNGVVKVTVLNVSGCGNTVAAGTVATKGSSPVPVRLITP
jgi:hypothetical protein